MAFNRTFGGPKLAAVAGFCFGLFLFFYVRPPLWQGIVIWILAYMAYPGDTTVFDEQGHRTARAFELLIGTIVIVWILYLLWQR